MADARVIRPAGFQREPLRVDDPAGGAEPAGGGEPAAAPEPTTPDREGSAPKERRAAGDVQADGGEQGRRASRAAAGSATQSGRPRRAAARQRGAAEQLLPPRRHEVTEALYADVPQPEVERFSEAAFKLGRRPPINGKRVAKHDLLGALIWKHVGTSTADINQLYELVEEWHANRIVRLRGEA